MKKLTILTLFMSSMIYAQTPTGSAPPSSVFPPNLPNVKDQSERAWYRGGNLAGGAAGGNNIFGTAAGFNSPIYTITNGLQRTKLNGTQNAVIAGVNQNVSG
jgi:hypothetical protein